MGPVCDDNWSMNNVSFKLLNSFNVTYLNFDDPLSNTICALRRINSKLKTNKAKVVMSERYCILENFQYCELKSIFNLIYPGKCCL